MTSYVAWNEIRPEYVARAGGEAAVEFKGVGSLNPQSGQYLRRAILGYQ